MMIDRNEPEEKEQIRSELVRREIGGGGEKIEGLREDKLVE